MRACLVAAAICVSAYPARAEIGDEINTARSLCVQQQGSVTPYLACLNEADIKVWKRHSAPQKTMAVIEAANDERLQAAQQYERGLITLEFLNRRLRQIDEGVFYRVSGKAASDERKARIKAAIPAALGQAIGAAIR